MTDRVGHKFSLILLSQIRFFNKINFRIMTEAQADAFNEKHYYNLNKKNNR